MSFKPIAAAISPENTSEISLRWLDPDTDEVVELVADDDKPFAGLAFKIATDPFVGRLTFFRVYTGTLEAGSYVLNATKGKRERVDMA